MVIVLFIYIISISIIFGVGSSKYREIITPLDRSRFPLKQLLPIGLSLLDIIGFRYNTPYDRMLLPKITEIYGSRYSLYYLRMHYANFVVYLLLALGFVLLVGSATRPDMGFLFFSVVLLGGVAYASHAELDKSIRKRRTLIELDFPEFVNKLVLLVSAGLTVGKAWERIALEHQKPSPLYEEVKAVITDIHAGKSEIKAYEEFAKRCRTPDITRFVSVVVQNIKRGSAELVPVLRIQSQSCWEMRKNAAKRLGEEASTKMLLPMMIMFVAILIIVATPAVIAISGV